MRLALLQTNPTLGEVHKNITAATNLLETLPSNAQLDLIVLPELAFSGYNFQSPSHIAPFVETRTSSPSREWAQKIAKQFRCSVLIGLPTHDTSRHNTAVLVDSTGTIVHEYYKHHMFGTDYKWGCTPGPGFAFTTLEFDDTPVRTSVGICMDLNPWEYKAPFSSYEFANYILENDITLIILPMAWLQSPEDEPNSAQPSHSNLKYWITRLNPLINDTKMRTVVVCNRTGQEEEAIYAGTSCVLRVGSGQVLILGLLGKEQTILTVDVSL
jgi:protein N-terminal amidase